jgi:hypothetical protein
MCGSPQYSVADIRTFEHIEDFAELRDRFEFANWRSYIKHGSFEIRIYQGTLNAREICNWIKIHARFIDIVKHMDFDTIDAEIGAQVRTNWRGLCNLIDDTDLLDYWRRKAQTHGTSLPALWAGEAETEAETEAEPQRAYAECGNDCDNCERPEEACPASLCYRETRPAFNPGVVATGPTVWHEPVTLNWMTHRDESLDDDNESLDLTNFRSSFRWNYPAPPERVTTDLANLNVSLDNPPGIRSVYAGTRRYTIVEGRAVINGRVNLNEWRNATVYYDASGQVYIVEHRD